MARKKVVKPTAEEKKRVQARLQKKYPQMYETKLSKREKKQFARASKADRVELEKMVGKKLKKLYGSK